MAGGIVRTDVCLDFDDAAGRSLAAAAHVAHEDAPQKSTRDLFCGSRVELCLHGGGLQP
jgi:hypothetical protein